MSQFPVEAWWAIGLMFVGIAVSLILDRGEVRDE
jgi:hypothetical protein